MLSDASDAVPGAFAKFSAFGFVLSFLVGLVVARGGSMLRYIIEVGGIATFGGIASGSIGAIIVFTAKV
jgi:hypothetical protein